MTQRFPCSWSQRCGVFTNTVELKCMSGQKAAYFSQRRTGVGEKDEKRRHFVFSISLTIHFVSFVHSEWLMIKHL